MTIAIQGLGWVTPLGGGLEEVWQRVSGGERAAAREIQNPHSQRKHFYFPVPPKLVDALGRNPRLRRSSPISYYAASAGLAALENAGIKLTPEVAERTAVVFAIVSGGVVYTRKFYDQVVRQGANAASPLLFPETVYNAPASHLAALLGLTGMSYTLVGDASVGLSAVKYAGQLLAAHDGLEHCVVVGAEEVDWVLCEAYRGWRLTSAEPCIEIGSNRGTVLAEGAAALVLGRDRGVAEVRAIHDGVSFFNRRQAHGAIARVHRELARDCHEEQKQRQQQPKGMEEGRERVNLAVSCANGTFIDAAEAAALANTFPDARVLYPKTALGESLGAGAITQVVYAAMALRGAQAGGGNAALVSVLGFNQQASGLVMSLVPVPRERE